MLLDNTSLAKTIDNCNDRLFWGKPIREDERFEVVQWISQRQGLPRSYSGTFAPTDQDLAQPLVLFTGEKVTTGAARSHILGEEATQLLHSLAGDDPAVKAVIGHAMGNFLPSVEDWYCQHPSATGIFCCGTCTPAFWRNIGAGGLREKQEWLTNGIRILKTHRKEDHQWKRFPFWWTVYALISLDAPGVKDELSWVAPRLERSLKRQPSDFYGERRRAVAERVLARI